MRPIGGTHFACGRDGCGEDSSHYLSCRHHRQQTSYYQSEPANRFNGSVRRVSRWIICLNHSFFVYNSFKPVRISQLLHPIMLQFEELFQKTFDVKKSNQFLTNVQVGSNSITMVLLWYLCIFVGCADGERLEEIS